MGGVVRLTSHKCEYVYSQGFYFSVPLTSMIGEKIG